MEEVGREERVKGEIKNKKEEERINITEGKGNRIIEVSKIKNKTRTKG